MALRLPLQFLLVVECESVQNSVLIIINRCHGALTVNLVDINLLFTFQYSVPPNLRGFAERQLQVTNITASFEQVNLD